MSETLNSHYTNPHSLFVWHFPLLDNSCVYPHTSCVNIINNQCRTLQTRSKHPNPPASSPRAGTHSLRYCGSVTYKLLIEFINAQYFFCRYSQPRWTHLPMSFVNTLHLRDLLCLRISLASSGVVISFFISLVCGFCIPKCQIYALWCHYSLASYRVGNDRSPVVYPRNVIA